MSNQREPADGATYWRTVNLGDSDPTTGGISYPEQKACLWNFRPTFPYRCTRERHNDGIHVATDNGVVVAVTEGGTS